MIVGHSVQFALDMWHGAQRHKDVRRNVYGEAAMLFACNAVDGTARAKSGERDGNARRFTQTIRDDLDIFEYIGMPDIADVLYYVHRCATDTAIRSTLA